MLHQKRHEFFRFKQFGKTVIEYEIELRELAEFVLELANSNEKVSDLYLVNLQRRVEILNLLRIHLDLRLIQLVLLKLSDYHNLPNWARHHRVLPSEVEQCQKNIPVVASFIQRLVAHHSCVFSTGRQDMLKDFARL